MLCEVCAHTHVTHSTMCVQFKYFPLVHIQYIYQCICTGLPGYSHIYMYTYTKCLVYNVHMPREIQSVYWVALYTQDI